MLGGILSGTFGISPYALPPLFAAVLSVPVAVEAWRNREEPAAEAFLATVLGLFAWSVFYAFELGFAGPDAQLFWRKLTLVVGSTIPPLWLLFTLRYAGLATHLPRGVKGIMASEPVVYGLLVFTNGSQGLIWDSVTAGEPGMTIEFTSLYYAHLGYLYALVLLGMGALAWLATDSATVYRRQSAVLLVATSFPFVANIASKAGLSPFPGVDLTTFGFSLAVSVIALAMFRFDLLNIVPVAHRRWLDQLEDGIVVVDREGRVIESNSVASEALTPPPSPGSLIAESLPGGGMEAATGRTIEAAVGNERQFYDIHHTTLTDHRGEPAGSLVGLRQVTDRTEYERRLEVANRVLRHNFRNAMNVIQGRSRLLADELSGEQAEHARTIEQRAEEVIELNEGIQQMVATLDKADSGTAVDVVGIVESVVAEHRERYPGVLFSVDAEPARAVVSDRKLLSRALGHLVENAAEYNDAADPSVVVSISSTAERVTVCVRDNGPGIPAVERSVVTEGRETPLIHGNGLGLWLVSWTVDACNGDLRFEENEPRGSVVVVELLATEDDRPQ
ncbi:histidine kinase N-terminal 7TM domain-containing protein [Halolamina sp.]|uniref:histidine kinase N-terminal 7TM domain-containing protein n=1 Tax=Halolamina sp. TaxID=1940283 RepID=UPI003561F117